MADITALLENLAAGSKNPGRYIIGDINLDGQIDINDLHILLNHENLKTDWYAE